jgi:hypothetical protein
MDVLHRLIQQLPPIPQAVVKSIAARAIDQYLATAGYYYYNGDDNKVKDQYQYHLPGAIFEDVMQMVSTEYIGLFRQSFLAVVGRDRQQQEQRQQQQQLPQVVVVTAPPPLPPPLMTATTTTTAVVIPKTTTTTRRQQQGRGQNPEPVISPLQLAMGYAFVLGMRHAQTSTPSSSSSSLDESLLDQARAQMYNVAPSERRRVWNEFVAVSSSLAKNNNNNNDGDGPVGGGDGVDPTSW